MSPLWRDEIGIHVAPRRVCMVRLGRGLSPKLLCEHEEQVECGSAGKWEAALVALDAVLGRSDWQGGAIRAVLADCWARYAIVPWVAELKSAHERLAHARQLLAGTFGDAVGGWEVRLSEAPPTYRRIACAFPAELLEGLRAVCRKYGGRLVSLQPQLVVAYQNWRNALPPSGAWFVTVGEGTMAAARLGLQGWDRVHSVRIGTAWGLELKRLQVFGRLAGANPDEGQVYVDAPHSWREVAGAKGENLHWLDEAADAHTTLERLGRVRRLVA